MYDYFQSGDFDKNGNALGEVLQHIKTLKTFDVNDFLHSEEAWNFITECYQKGTSEKPFIE